MRSQLHVARILRYVGHELRFPVKRHPAGDALSEAHGKVFIAGTKRAIRQFNLELVTVRIDEGHISGDTANRVNDGLENYAQYRAWLVALAGESRDFVERGKGARIGRLIHGSQSAVRCGGGQFFE